MAQNFPRGWQRPNIVMGRIQGHPQASGLVHWYPILGSQSGYPNVIATDTFGLGYGVEPYGGNTALVQAPSQIGGKALRSTGAGNAAISAGGIATYRFKSKASLSVWVKLVLNTPTDEFATGFCGMSDPAVVGRSHYPYSDGVIYCAVFRTSTRYGFSPLSSVDKTKPHLVTITTDGTKYRFYQNAQLVYEDAADASIGFPYVFQLNSLHGSDGTYWLNGWSWDWRLYNVALTLKEIQAMYDPATRYALYWGV